MLGANDMTIFQKSIGQQFVQSLGRQRNRMLPPGCETVEAVQGLWGHLPWTYDQFQIQDTRYLNLEEIWTHTSIGTDGVHKEGSPATIRSFHSIHRKYGDIFHIEVDGTGAGQDGCFYRYDLSEENVVTVSGGGCLPLAAGGGFGPGSFITPTEYFATTTVQAGDSTLNTWSYRGTLSNPNTIADATALAEGILEWIDFPSDTNPNRVYDMNCLSAQTYADHAGRFGLDATPLTAAEISAGMRIYNHILCSWSRDCTRVPPNEFGGGTGGKLITSGTSCSPFGPISRRIYASPREDGYLNADFPDSNAYVHLKRGRYRTTGSGALRLCESIQPYHRLTNTYPQPYTCGLKTNLHGTYIFDVPETQEDHWIYIGGPNPPSPGGGLECCNSLWP